jgi:hypothetical protein
MFHQRHPVESNLFRFVALYLTKEVSELVSSFSVSKFMPPVPRCCESLGCLLGDGLSGCSQGLLMSLDKDASRFRTGCISIPNLEHGGDFEWPVFVFAQPRPCRQRMFWSTDYIYKYFNMKSYQGVASAWWSRQVPPLEKGWLKAYGHPLHVGSTMVHAKNQQKLDKPFNQRCLPENAVSTLGVLDVLHRWSDPQSKVGLRSVENGSGLAAALLQRLIQMARFYKGRPATWSMLIALSATWAPRFPQPELPADGLATVLLQVSPELVVDILPLLSAADRGSLFAQEALRCLPHDHDHRANPGLALEVLIARWSAGRTTRSLLQQLVYRLSIRIEFVAGTGEGGAIPLERVPTFFWKGDEGLLSVDRAPYCCASYVMASKSLYDKPLHTAIATDKGWAHGLPLQATILSWPAGGAVIAPPQVHQGTNSPRSSLLRYLPRFPHTPFEPVCVNLK